MNVSPPTSEAEGLSAVEGVAQVDAPVLTSINLPVDVRSASLAVLAMLAVVFALKWAAVVLIPIALAAFLSYVLRPLVVVLRRYLRLPEALGALVALSLAVGSIVAGVSALEPQVTHFIDSMPKATRKLENLLRRSALDKTGAMQKLLAAADGLERAAARPADGNARARRSEELAAEPLKLRSYLWSGTEAMIQGMFQGTLVLALSYFLLISSQSLKRKLVKVSGNTLSAKKITVRILDEIDTQIQRYVLIQVGTSAIVGIGTGIAFALIGLENAVFWGVAAGVLHLIPYVGSALVLMASALLAWLQFDSIDSVLLVTASVLAITGAIGFGLVPWLTEKVGRINAVVTLVSLMIWEWLWGIPGLLLGVPIMMALMAVCERVESLQPVAELLSGDARSET